MTITLTRPMDLSAATERANRWLDTARPIIKAMCALEDAIDEHLLPAIAEARGNRRWDAPRTPGERTYDEAEGYINKGRDQLFEMLDGIRDSFLADELPPAPFGDDEQAWTDRDEFSDALGGVVTSVDAAINQIGG